MYTILDAFSFFNAWLYLIFKMICLVQNLQIASEAMLAEKMGLKMSGSAVSTAPSHFTKKVSG